jgi:hypothetical protein
MISAVWMCANITVNSNYDGRLAFWAAVGAAAGIFLFVRGFLMLRFKRMIENTPASKIRSASMGLVELSGLAEGPQTIPAGITGEACFYYRAIAWQLKESGRNRSWKKVADESLYVPFFINDVPGRMLVDAAGADMEVTKNFHDEFSSSFFGTRDMLPENVSSFLARNGVLGGATVKLEERCVKPGYPLFIFGTLSTHSTAGRADWSAKPHAAAASALEMKVDLRDLWHPLKSNHALSPVQAALLSGNVPLAPAAAEVAPTAATWSSVSIDEVAMAHNRANTGAAVADAPSVVAAPEVVGRASLDEVATMPTSDLGMPQPVAICKGTENAPFMISCESQREILRALGWKCALCIWGGPIVTLVSVYYLLLCLGLT